ncbi:MAG: hypothetical protein JXQ87_01895 [Bacteroidia bacterium]
MKTIFKNALWLNSLLTIILLLGACGDDNPVEKPTKNKSGKGLIILNEGLFNRGNSSLSFISKKHLDKGFRDSIINGHFEKINKLRIGDVGHSITLIDSLLYIVANNSGLIHVIDTHSHVLIKTITGFTSPRYIEKVDENLALVGDLYSNTIAKVNLNTLEIAGNIGFNGQSERMVTVGKNVWVSNNTRPYLYILDPFEENISDSLFIGAFCNELYEYRGELIALANAQSYEVNKGALIFISPAKKEIVKKFEFESAEKSWYGRMTTDGESIYLKNENTILLYSNDQLNQVLSFDDMNAYNIFVHQNKLFVCNAKDYQSQGEVIVYNNNYNQISSLKTGIIPSSLIWIE